MANLNYVGSVAERFMKFRSSLSTEENISENLFNAISIYIPKSLASANLASGSYDPEQITAEKYAVIAVTADNYRDVLNQTGALITQWLPIFNDGANVAVTLYLVIFDDTGFTPTLGDKSIVWNPLKKAFDELYFISFFKTMFSEHYDGTKVEDGYDDSNYFDMALCLSYQCELESTLSMFLCEITVKVPEGTDANVCKIMSVDKATEVANATTFIDTDVETRAQNFWGFLYLMGMTHTELHVHNGSYMIPIVLGKWFEQTNATGQYIGNKLSKIRLSGNKVKPTGLPSPLDSNVNLNLPKAIYDILDEKIVGYFISIADNSMNNAELVRERTGSDFPVTAYMLSKFIDYKSSQDIAKYATDNATLTDPVMVNQKTYNDIQGLLVANLQLFAGLGRLTDVVISFPPFSEAKKGNRLEGIGAWKATYVDDLEGVTVAGAVSF